MTPGKNHASTRAATDRETAVTWLTLVAASGTLVCCTIPILLVTLGFSGAVIALTANVPFLVTLTHYKLTVCALSFALLALSGWLLYRPGRACPTDPELARLCGRLQVWNRRVYWFSVVVWLVGFFFAFLLLPIRIALHW